MTSGIVVVAWNGDRYLEACLRSILAQTAPPSQIVLVDNASNDNTLSIAQSMVAASIQCGIDFTILQETDNIGFTRGANHGLRALLERPSPVDVAIVLNQDTALDPTWCEVTVAAFTTRERVGAVGSRLLMPNRQTLQHAGGYLELPRQVARHFRHHEPVLASESSAIRDVEFVTAAAIAMRSSTLRTVGLFDEIFSPGYYEDVEWCVRAREAGWSVVYVPTAVAIHWESASFLERVDRLRLSHRNRLIFALPLMADLTFRTEFWKAEREYAETQAPPDERRALAAAYLSFLLRLDEASRARIPGPVRSPQLLSELIDGFANLRERVLNRGVLSKEFDQP